MKICVFGAASSEIDNNYIVKTEELCCEMARRSHELVFGAGANGLMGAAARGTKRGGGRITGVIPTFFKEESIEAIYDECDEIIYTDSMRDRKMKMEDLADAFIIVPGGIGTFEELFEVMTLKQLGRHNKPIAIYNLNGYYDDLMRLMKLCSDEGFIRELVNSLYICTDNAEELLLYVENTDTVKIGVKELKQG